MLGDRAGLTMPRLAYARRWRKSPAGPSVVDALMDADRLRGRPATLR